MSRFTVTVPIEAPDGDFDEAWRRFRMLFWSLDGDALYGRCLLEETIADLDADPELSLDEIHHRLVVAEPPRTVRRAWISRLRRGRRRRRPLKVAVAA